MSISFITGLPGSGKSYESVAYHIIPALKLGRRVVTNVAGLSIVNIAAYLEISVTQLETLLILVDSSHLDDPDSFWYSPTNPDTVIQKGDLVVLDEIWAYFSRSSKIHPAAMSYIRMHRHYVSEVNSFSSDIVFITQSLRGIHVDLKSVVETIYQVRKLKVLGTAKAYDVVICSPETKKPISVEYRAYDSSIFPLYSSYSGGTTPGVEVIDKRQTLFNRKSLVYGLAFSVVFLIFGSYYAYKSLLAPVEASKNSSKSLSSESSAPVVSSPKSIVKPVPVLTHDQPVINPSSSFNSDSEAKLIGTYSRGAILYGIYSDSVGLYSAYLPSIDSSKIYLSINTQPKPN